MQCKNCGSHYRMRDLACPYCGTENALGKVWMKQRTDAEIAYEKERIAAGKRWSPFIYNRAVSRIIVVEVVLFVLLFLFIAGFFGAKEAIYSIVAKKSKDDVINEMKTLMEEQKYEEMQYYWQEYRDKIDETDPQMLKIKQLSDLVHAHNEYVNSKFEFLYLSEDEKKSDDYRLAYTIRTAFRVYAFEPSYKEEMQPETQVLLDRYKEEVHAFMVGLLKMTEEDFNEMMSLDYIPYGDNTWEQIVRDRNGW